MPNGMVWPISTPVQSLVLRHRGGGTNLCSIGTEVLMNSLRVKADPCRATRNGLDRTHSTCQSAGQKWDETACFHLNLVGPKIDTDKVVKLIVDAAGSIHSIQLPQSNAPSLKEFRQGHCFESGEIWDSDEKSE